MNDTLPSRRQMITGAVAVLGGLAAGSRLLAQTPAAAPEKTVAVDPRTSLHQEAEFPASPQRIYEALLDSRQFALFSGMPAEIDPKAGGAFAMFKGQIEGRNIELLPNQRIVQAWRPAHWDAGVYSIVRFVFKPHDAVTLVVLDHTGFPEGEFKSLSWGWNNHYWEGLKKYFA